MAYVEGLRIHRDLSNFNDMFPTLEFPGKRFLATESKVSTIMGHKTLRRSESKTSTARLGVNQKPPPEPLHIFVLGPSLYGKRRLIECFTNCKMEIPTEKNIQLAYKVSGFLLQGIDVEIFLWHIDNAERSLSILQVFYQMFKTSFMLTYDVNDSITFDNVRQWIPSLRYVLGDNVRIVLVGYEDPNDILTSKSLPVSYSDGMNAKTFFELEAFYEFPDMIGSVVSELFFEAAHIALESKVTTPDSELPESEEKINI